MKHRQRRVVISEETDVAKATSEAMALANEVGFKESEQCMIATAVSELARNIVFYAMKGEVIIKVIDRKTKRGIEIVAEDNGSGIKDIGQAMKDHFSTSGSLGLGLPGVKRLTDEFIIDTKRKRGTKITVRKWL